MSYSIFYLISQCYKLIFNIAGAKRGIKLNEYRAQYNEAQKLLIATTITSLRKLLKDPIYNEIEAQPFFRIYATISKKYIDIILAFFVIQSVLALQMGLTI